MVSAETVRELRAQTGAGIMECKSALVESDGDIEKAIDLLRKQGIVKAAKKASRATGEGLIAIATAADGASLGIVEVNCETDFVARTDEFRNFVQQLAEQAAQEQPASLEDFLSSTAEKLKAIISKLGENITIARFDLLKAEGSGQKCGSYIHAGNQIGVAITVQGDIPDEGAREIAMHIAAMRPFYLNPEQVPADVAEREKEILKGADDLQSKPPEVIEKIILGRYRKFLDQNCLTEQAYIKDPEGKKTVGSYLKSIDPQAQVLSFLRYQVGESSSPQ